MHDIVKVVTILADRILVCNIGFIDLSIKTELSCFAYRFMGTLCHTRIVTYLEYLTNEMIILDVNFVLFDTIVVKQMEFNDMRLILKGFKSFLFHGLQYKMQIFLGLVLTLSSLLCQLYVCAIMMMKSCLAPISSCR